MRRIMLIKAGGLYRESMDWETRFRLLMELARGKTDFTFKELVGLIDD